MNRLWTRLVKDEKGSMTVEASLVMPIVLLVTFSFILLAMQGYHAAKLQRDAVMTMARAAGSWVCCTASSGSSGEGESSVGHLYWRWQEGGVRSWLDTTEDGKVEHRLPLPVQSTGAYEAQPALRKLATAAKPLGRDVIGELSYVSKLLGSSINADVRTGLRTPMLLLVNDKAAAAKSISGIADPVEWTRNTEMIRGYALRLQERGMSQGEAK